MADHRGCPKHKGPCDVIIVFPLNNPDKSNLSNLRTNSLFALNGKLYRPTGWDTFPGGYRELHCERIN